LGEIFLGKKQTFKTTSASRFNPEEYDQKLSQHSTVTFAYEWTIKAITDQCSDQVSGHPLIESAAFSPPNHPDYKFNLLLYPKGVNDDSAGHISLLLHLASSPTDTLAALYKFSILNANNQKCNTKGGKLRL